MFNQDFVTNFSLYSSDVKGVFVQLSDSVKNCFRLTYSDNLKNLIINLGNVACIIGAQQKENIILTVSYTPNNSNLLKYITIDYESPGYIRSYVKIIEDIKEDESFEFLSGLIKITVDYKDLKRQRYEGVISVEQKSITDSFEQYFLQSEQIETKLKIFLMGNSSSALMIQKLPQLNYQDAFKEASLFIDTISLAELTKYQNGHWQELLNKIFIFSNLQIFNISPISYKCRCSKERMIVALKTIPKTDLLLQAQQENGIEVKCEFCNNIINFTIEDISVL